MMQKKYGSVLGLVLLIGSLTGCGKEAAPPIEKDGIPVATRIREEAIDITLLGKETTFPFPFSLVKDNVDLSTCADYPETNCFICDVYSGGDKLYTLTVDGTVDQINEDTQVLGISQSLLDNPDGYYVVGLREHTMKTYLAVLGEPALQWDQYLEYVLVDDAVLSVMFDEDSQRPVYEKLHTADCP